MQTENEKNETLSIEEALVQVKDDTTREIRLFRFMIESEKRNSQNHDIHHFCGRSRDLSW
jgi:hypothetical protein